MHTILLIYKAITVFYMHLVMCNTNRCHTICSTIPLAMSTNEATSLRFLIGSLNHSASRVKVRPPVMSEPCSVNCNEQEGTVYHYSAYLMYHCCIYAYIWSTHTFYV